MTATAHSIMHTKAGYAVGKGLTTAYTTKSFQPHLEDTDDIQHVQVEVDDSHQDEAGGAVGGTLHYQMPPYLPLTPHYTHPTSASGAELLHLIKFLEQTRRKPQEARRYQKDELRRREEEDRFTTLLQLFTESRMATALE
ncbi:hypothetical protein E2C01_064364 [Portunus trituberculatus]|uniref:Uncharacterized protein n=1 Tax=Portunus trituberculatus TaxID=210409 RepID=A0A5B7HKL7_PORTR|nr:hypothetical protein [Portunus trituberculatus]